MILVLCHFHRIIILLCKRETHRYPQQEQIRENVLLIIIMKYMSDFSFPQNDEKDFDSKWKRLKI